MPLALKPNEIVLAIKDHIEPWAKARKGNVSVANNPFEALELLAQSPAGFRVVILWEGDEDATGQPLVGIVNNNISLIVSANRGLRIWNGENLHKPYGDQPALLDLLTELRIMVRDQVWPDVVSEGAMLYLGADPEITPEGYPLDAYRLRFRLTTVIPSSL